MTTTSAPAADRSSAVRGLLTCGVVAGPLFLAVWAAQAATRDGFDPLRHPLSLLANGDGGWVQSASFVVTGVLFLACAVGLRAATRAETAVTGVRRGQVAGPLGVAALGAGLAVAGVFPADPGAGFPAGAPAGAPTEVTTAGALHGVGAMLAFVGAAVGCLVLARRFALLGERAWAVAAVGTGVAALLLGAPGPGLYSVRLVVGSAVLFAFVAALAIRARRATPSVATTGTATADGHGVQHARAATSMPVGDRSQ